MGFRGSIAGITGFGLALGLSLALVMQRGWDITGLPTITLLAMVGAIVAAGFGMQTGWSLGLVVSSGAMLVASLGLRDEGAVLVPLAASAILLALARFGGLRFVSRWGARVVGGAALLLLVVLGWNTMTGNEPVDSAGWTVLALLAGIAVVGFVPRRGSRRDAAPS